MMHSIRFLETKIRHRKGKRSIWKVAVVVKGEACVLR